MSDTTTAAEDPQADGQPVFTLTITGNAETMGLIVDAVDLLGRLHLGQFDRAQHELVRAVENVLYEPQVEDQSKAEQQMILQVYLNDLAERMRAEENAWHRMRSRLRTRGDTLFGNLHHNDRERIAYALWKKIGNALSIARGFQPRDDYAGPAGGSLTVSLTKDVPRLVRTK